ncbi:hypothetical protein [Undibacterium oligocarboniphilum]|uniref:DUF4412 domain-containing protein n=1 Tax=Undibacterium oligocarboniphilum TaxID=666702 RepID=A0A850QIG6_9BURK|nr:hypothetical protein [Undibacterium oligocarboniphilum]MBC3871505.1 hypothetical protein [Undibacterium oligocarboniphilum]NVO78919.1 hypothetical protein [Undibacterium oligocarboniphilum]
MKTSLKITAATFLIATAMSAFADVDNSKISITSKGNICQFIQSEGNKMKMAQGECAWFEDANLIQKKDDTYVLSNLSEAMGSSLWKAIESALPKRTKIPAAAYYLNVDILGHKHELAATPGQIINLKDSVHFAYLGNCLSQSDMKTMRKAVMAGGVESELVKEQARNRPAHRPTNEESAEMNTGAWVYDMKIMPADKDAIGETTLTLSGEIAGPIEFEAVQAQKCNGYIPSFTTINIPQITVRLKDQANVKLPLVGNVSIQVIKESKN